MFRKRRGIAYAAMAGTAWVLLGCASPSGGPEAVALCRVSLRATLQAALAPREASPASVRWRRGSTSHVDWYDLGCVTPSRLLPDGQWIQHGVDTGHGYFKSFGPTDTPTDAWGCSIYACWIIDRIRDAPYFQDSLLDIMCSQALEPQLRCQALRALSGALDRTTAALISDHLDDPAIGMEAMHALAENPELAIPMFRRGTLPISALARSRMLWIIQRSHGYLGSRDLEVVADELAGPCSAQALSVLFTCHAKHSGKVEALATAAVERSEMTHMAYALLILVQEWIDSVGAVARTHAKVGAGMQRELAIQYLGLSPYPDDLAVALTLARDNAQPIAVRASALLSLSASHRSSDTLTDVALQLAKSRALRVVALYALSRGRDLPNSTLTRIAQYVEDPDPDVSQLASEITQRRK